MAYWDGKAFGERLFEAVKEHVDLRVAELSGELVQAQRALHDLRQERDTLLELVAELAPAAKSAIDARGL